MVVLTFDTSLITLILQRYLNGYLSNLLNVDQINN